MVERWSPKPKVQGSSPFFPGPRAVWFLLPQPTTRNLRVPHKKCHICPSVICLRLDALGHHHYTILKLSIARERFNKKRISV